MSTTDPAAKVAALERGIGRFTSIGSRVLYVVVVAVLFIRPGVLFPVSGPYCGFCFRKATGEVTYRMSESGETFNVSVCENHARYAPKSAPAGTLGFFKVVIWIVMVAASGFAFLALGKSLFVEPPAPGAEFGAGCIFITLVPMLGAELLHLGGFHITGRIAGWVSIFLMFSAAMAMAIPVAAPQPPREA